MAYKDIPITESAERCGIMLSTQQNDVEIRINCPFCNETKRRMHLNVQKNVFKCHHCGESGNSITFYAKHMGIDNRAAYAELCNHGVTRQGCQGQQDGQRDAHLNSRNTAQKTTSLHNAPLQTLSYRDTIYSTTLEFLPLSDEHHENLLQRGLDEDTIKRNRYKSLPKKHSEYFMERLKEIMEVFDLTGVPGFFPTKRVLANEAEATTADAKTNWHLPFHIYTRPGLLIPVLDENGLIQGLQIRLDNVTDSKYRWFSSAFADGGTACPSFTHVRLPQGELREVPQRIFLTEGALKADVIAHLMNDNAFVIALAGVGNHKGLLPLLKRCVEQFGSVEFIECFDMDKRTNLNVMRALEQVDFLVDTLIEEVGADKLTYRHATWDSAQKGLDDALLYRKMVQAGNFQGELQKRKVV